MVAVVLLLAMHFYFYICSYVQKADYKFYDLTTNFFHESLAQENATYSVIVDIDEKSIKTFGQWPWSRVINVELIERIKHLSPSAIGINILFPEQDRTSPLLIQEFYQEYFKLQIDLEQFPKVLHDHDKLFAEVIKKVNATLPIYLQSRFHSEAHCQEMRYKNNFFAKHPTRLFAEELICNHPSLQDGVENFGFINAWSDGDGILRRLPLFIRYKEEVFPSFALATLLSFYEAVGFNEEEESLLLNFAGDTPKVISAMDIFDEKVNREDIQGKVVILGSSLVGLNATHRTALGKEVSTSMIHALLVDNILNDAYLIQPIIYKKINIILSFLISGVLMVLLYRKRYLATVIFTLFLLFTTALVLFFTYRSGLYLSIGYLWTPLFSTAIVLVLHHLSVLNQEQREQEHFLIRQSKMASMGEMLSLIAHQWRQPLSSINGTVLNMDIDYRKNRLERHKFDDYLNEIERTTAYLSKTISDFTNFFSTDKQRHLFKVSNVIEQVEHLASMSLKGNVEIIHTQNEEIEVNGYSSELIQSLLVLVNNAIYICQKNIETIGHGEIEINVRKVAKELVLSVEDNGGGIDKIDIKKIFDPYFTTKGKQHGTGLGLYILKMIVEDSMNGKVSVFNGEKGAVFIIEIPLNMG